MICYASLIADSWSFYSKHLQSYLVLAEDFNHNTTTDWGWQSDSEIKEKQVVLFSWEIENIHLWQIVLEKIVFPGAFIFISVVSLKRGKRAVTVSLPQHHPATLPWPSPTSPKDSTQHRLFPRPRRPTQAAGHQTTPQLCSAHAWSPNRLTPTRPTRGPNSGQAASTALAHRLRNKSPRRKRRVSPCLPN